MSSDQPGYGGERPDPAPEGVPADAKPSGIIVSTGVLSEAEFADLKRRFLAAQHGGEPVQVLPLRDDGGDDPRPQEV